ncbi:uncharacterized protein ALTATR162_LOCUS3661 [Alternaria atra]|uniref:Uncharacterized protein n=1 Tax=Alternaria atra TaxID=119953 RepID=A0A8J2HX49_9PLEO|nr:uncharacterized protein ALTATR162_LOCUS3661 [Alternaria atra]CAG5155436.1 unnamed protein product [Alternaria atra]
MEPRKHKRKPQVGDRYTSSIPWVVSTWHTTTVDLFLDRSWQTATLEFLEDPTRVPATVYYLTHGFTWNTRLPELAAPGAPLQTSGEVAVSMTIVYPTTTQALFIYGILDISATSTLSSLAAASSSASRALVTTSQTSAQQQSSPTTGQQAATTTAANGNGNGKDNNSSLSSGAIAGIAIGGVLVLALIIGGWFFWRRHKCTRAAGSSSRDDRPARRDGEISEIDTKHPPQEMPGNHQTQAQELDPTHSAMVAMIGTHKLKADSEPSELPNGRGYHYEPAHALNPNTRPGGLPNGETGRTLPVRHQDLEPAAETTETTSNATSQNVEAQRRREMEWLEMEEERIRKRREMLAMQGGGKT